MIVDAQQVAVHQQHASSVKIDHRAVPQELDAGFAQKALPMRKSRLPWMKYVLTPARVTAAALEHAPLVRVGIVVADPRFEQVAQDVQRFGARASRSRKSRNCAVMSGRVPSRCRSEMKASSRAWQARRAHFIPDSMMITA
jgi:hypothetical protein